MSLELILALVAASISVGLVSGSSAWLVLARRAPERRRLKHLGPTTRNAPAPSTVRSDDLAPALRRVASVVPKSPKELSRLRRRLGQAGFRSMSAAVLFAGAELALPVALAGIVFAILGSPGWIVAVVAAAAGYLLPSLWLSTRTKARKKVIRNGLPDVLDLIIVCLEAGCALDQAIVKATDELDITYPALAEEMRLITTETRAGKPRLEAFRNFADRTGVDDVRALVAMLIQTDRFGTSLAQALRTHAQTSRIKRRQRAEERAAKVGVKLVFPLVFCLFPAFYVVTLGPAIIQFIRVFFGQIMQR